MKCLELEELLTEQGYTPEQVDEKLSASDGAYGGEIILDGDNAQENIVEEVTDYFGEGRDEVETLVELN